MLKWLFIITGGILVCFLSMVQNSMALNFAANWQYFDTSESKARFSQTYSLILSSWATNALSTGLSLRYTRQDQGEKWQELYTPVFYLNLLNDWFNFNFSATATENRRSKGPDLSTRSWDSNIISKVKDYNVRAYYGWSSQKDDQHPRRINTDNNHWGISVSKEWNIFSIFTDYRGTTSKDKVEKSKTDTNTYFIKGEISDSWKKLHYSFSQQINYTNNKWRSQKKTVRGKLPINISVNWKLANSGEIGASDYIILDIDNNEINLIVFYKNGNFLEEISSDVKWKIEWSNDQVLWHTIAENISLPYEFSTTFSEGSYIKLTVISGRDDLNSPLVKVYKYLPAGVTAYTFDSTVLRSDLSLLYSFNEKKNISYNFSYNKNLPDPGKNSTNTSHNITTFWWMNKLLQTSTSFSFNRDKIQGQKSKKNYSFSANITSEFLETLTTTTTYTHSINKKGNTKISSVDAITLSTFAELYPDLELRWDINYNHGKNFEENSKIDGINTHINLIARLKPSLTLNSIYDYTYTKNKGETTTTTTDQFFNIDVTWRPSDSLLLRGSESVKWGKAQKTTINHNYSLWMNVNPKIQLNFLYNGTRRKGQNSDHFSGNISWTISRYLFFRSSYAWENTGGDKSWTLMFSLSLTF